MGILEEIAKIAMAPKLKKKFEKAAEIVKDDPELLQALKDLEGYKGRLEEIQYTLLERNKDHPKYDPVEQAKRRQRIESRKYAEEKEKEDLFDLLEKFNFFCNKSYWFNQDIKDLKRIVTYLEKVGPLEIDGLDKFFEEFIKKNNDSNLLIKPTSLKNYKSDKGNLKEDPLNIKLAIDKINNKIQWDNVIIFIAPNFIFTKNSLHVLPNDSWRSDLDNPTLNFSNLESIRFDKFKKNGGKDKAYEFKKGLFLSSCVIWFIIGWIGYGISATAFNFLLIGVFIGFLTGFNPDQDAKLYYKEIGKKNYKHFRITMGLKTGKFATEKTELTNSAIDLFNNLKADLKEFLEIYKKEHIKIAPKLLEEIKKLTKN